MPDGKRHPGALLGRIRRLLGGRPAAGGTGASELPRWPHLMRGWLDPDMPLAGFRTTVEATDVEEVLRAVESRAECFGEREVGEVLDALAHTAGEGARAFRFGRTGTFKQVWIGVVPGQSGGVRVFVLGSAALVESVEAELSVAKLASSAKRSEYETLGRFLVTAWGWQWLSAPWSAEIRRAAPKGFDPTRTIESMDRVLSSPGSPLLEILRGLRRRTLDLLEETRGLDEGAVRATDEHLAAKGAATLTEMRRRFWDRSS